MNFIYPSSWLACGAVGLVFLRLLGFFLLVPGLSHKAVPPVVKVLLAMTLALALYPVVAHNLPILSFDLVTLVVAVIRETVVGFLMGFIAYLTFEGISLAAQFVGYQMGFGTAGLMDPVNQSSASLLVPLQSWLALLVFLMCDLHHEFISVFVASYDLTAPSLFATDGKETLSVIANVSGRIFTLAVQLAAPYTLVVLSCNVGMGVLSRMIPQMNILLFSFPITILLGLACLYVFVPELVGTMESVLNGVTTDMAVLLRSL